MRGRAGTLPNEIAEALRTNRGVPSGGRREAMSGTDRAFCRWNSDRSLGTPWRPGLLNRHPTMGATMLTTILIVLLILLLLGAIPSWPYSRGWGYGPSGILGIVLIVILILALTGRV
jgi:hypothetical protein